MQFITQPSIKKLYNYYLYVHVHVHILSLTLSYMCNVNELVHYMYIYTGYFDVSCLAHACTCTE